MATSPSFRAPALTFTFSAQSLRVILRDGEPWFVSADVCDALTIGNNRDAVSRLDDDERGVATTDTPSGQQEMTIINESGLYSLILTSRKPEAKKFKKWVTSEVLPSIRKTGAYVASNAPQATTTPAHVNERLSGADIQNIKRMIWFASRGFQYEGSWTQAIWFYLRALLSVPSPHPFGVDHLPMLAIELQRICAISSQVQDVVAEIERTAAKRIFRKGEDADMVIADIRRVATLRMTEVRDDMAKLPGWLHKDIAAIVERRDCYMATSYGTDEKIGYFEQGASA